MNRKTVRKYSDQPVTEAVKQAILTATFRAPTAGAMMLYSIIDVIDPSLKEQLAINCDHQPFIAKAPWLLLFLADYQRWFDYYETSDAASLCEAFNRQPRQPQEGDFLLACMDALIAAQTAVVAAESLGVGSCYIGDIIENYEKTKMLFNLPKYTAPVALLCFGYPVEAEKKRKMTSRFDKKYIYSENQYRRFSADELADMFPETDKKAENPFAELPVGQQNYIRKFTADFSVEMSRSAREILKNWQSDEN